MKDHPPARTLVLSLLGPGSWSLISVVVSMDSCTSSQFWSVGQTDWQEEKDVGGFISCLPRQCPVLFTVLEFVLLLERIWGAHRWLAMELTVGWFVGQGTPGGGS